MLEHTTLPDSTNQRPAANIPRIKSSHLVHTGVTIKRENRKFPLDALQLTGIGKRDVIANIGRTIHSSLDITEVQYNNEQSIM